MGNYCQHGVISDCDYLIIMDSSKTYKDSVLTFEKGLFKSIHRLIKKITQ